MWTGTPLAAVVFDWPCCAGKYVVETVTPRSRSRDSRSKEVRWFIPMWIVELLRGLCGEATVSIHREMRHRRLMAHHKSGMFVKRAVAAAVVFCALASTLLLAQTL